MLCALQYNFPRRYSDYRFFVVIESYNQQYTLDMKAILLEEAYTIRAASKVYQLTMVLEPRGEFTLPPIFGQPAPFLESLSLKFDQTDGWYLFLLRKFPLIKARLFASVTSNLRTLTLEKNPFPCSPWLRTPVS